MYVDVRVDRVEEGGRIDVNVDVLALCPSMDVAFGDDVREVEEEDDRVCASVVVESWIGWAIIDNVLPAVVEVRAVAFVALVVEWGEK